MREENLQFTSDKRYSLHNQKITGINKEDVGKVEIKDKITEVVIYGGKEDIILKELKKAGIKKRVYKMKKL